jgi:2-methylcitrate dehydratase PrpD
MSTGIRTAVAVAESTPYQFLEYVLSETKALATYLVNSRLEDIPEDVRHESRRALLNYIGCAVGGSREPAVETALRALTPYFGKPTTGLLARTERMDPFYAALINGISSHVFEYDDTMPKNYIHPTPPVASALFAYASTNRVNGRDFVHAFLLGFETEARVGNAVYPAHYEAGWHITSTAGVFGAAAAIGKLLPLSTQQMIWALGLAATQASGLREMFGYMAKSFHAGRAAQNGYSGAILAQSDFTAGERAIEGPRGFAPVTASTYDLSKITNGLGEDFQIRYNTYKPYPCGLVVHPAIDGCIDLHAEHRPAPDSIRQVRVRVAPLVMDLCNKKDITRGLEGKYSIYHSSAVGLVRGKAGLQEYTDAAVNDPLVKQVRERVTAISDSSITEDQAHIEVELQDGRKLVRFVEQSLGNVHRPLTDKQLEEKLRDQCIPALTGAQVDRLIELCWKIDQLDDVSEVVKATVRS